jgi:hypothetical protein
LAPSTTGGGNEVQNKTWHDAINTNLFNGLGVSGSPMFVS